MDFVIIKPLLTTNGTLLVLCCFGQYIFRFLIHKDMRFENPSNCVWPTLSNFKRVGYKVVELDIRVVLVLLISLTKDACKKRGRYLLEL